jgi:hypothetical protein
LMELWESGSGTYHGRGRHLVTAWWLLFLGSRFFGVFTSMWESGVDEYDISALISYNIVVVVQNLLLGAAATSGALMVYRITRRQEQPEGVPGDVADVFA